VDSASLAGSRDGDGIVRWTTVATNVRVRPTPATVLAAIDALPEGR
jgi:hypothetical protein